MEDTTSTEDQSQGRGRYAWGMPSALGCPSSRGWIRQRFGRLAGREDMRGPAGSTLWQALNDMLGHFVSTLLAIKRKPKVWGRKME